jgi:hypothetical protein
MDSYAFVVLKIVGVLLVGVGLIPAILWWGAEREEDSKAEDDEE